MNKERYLNDQDRKYFLELITPFMDRIRLASEGKGRLNNKGQVKEYKTIFDKYIKDPKSEELNIGCNNCMGLSYKQTIGKYERELKANGGLPVFNMELIEDTDVNVYLVDKEVGKFMTFPKQEPITVEKEYREEDGEYYVNFNKSRINDLNNNIKIGDDLR